MKRYLAVVNLSPGESNWAEFSANCDDDALVKAEQFRQEQSRQHYCEAELTSVTRTEER